VKYVVQAVRQFGIDALRLNANDEWRIHPLSQEEINKRMARFNETALSLLPKEPPEKRDTSAAPVIQLTKGQLKRLTNRKERSPDEQEDSSAWISDLEEKPERRDPLGYLHPLARAQEEAELRELRWREGLGPVICDVLRFWREQVERGSLKERRLAAKHLREFSKALIPETRGKRKSTLRASYYEVKKFYYRALYRLYHLENALRTTPGSRTEKVRAASKNFEIPLETIRELWRLNEDDSPKGRPDPIRQRARLLTARHFRVTEPAVSNIIAS